MKRSTSLFKKVLCVLLAAVMIAGYFPGPVTALGEEYDDQNLMIEDYDVPADESDGEWEEPVSEDDGDQEDSTYADFLPEEEPEQENVDFYSEEPGSSEDPGVTEEPEEEVPAWEKIDWDAIDWDSVDWDEPSEEDGESISGEGVLYAYGPDYTISISYGPEAGIPAGSGLSAYEAGSDGYLAAAAAAAGCDPASSAARFFVFTVYDSEGVEVVPASGVTVTVSCGVPENAGADARPVVVCFDGGSAFAVSAEVSRDGTASFRSEGSAVFGLVYPVYVTAEEPAAEEPSEEEPAAEEPAEEEPAEEEPAEEEPAAEEPAAEEPAEEAPAAEEPAEEEPAEEEPAEEDPAAEEPAAEEPAAEEPAAEEPAEGEPAEEKPAEEEPEEKPEEAVSEEPVYGSGVLEFAGEGFSASVSYGEDAQIPEGSSLQVTEIGMGTEAYDACLAAAGSSADAAARFFELSITDREGLKVVPASDVAFTVSCTAPEGVSAEAVPSVVCFDGSGSLSAAAEVSGDGAASFSASDLSACGFIYPAEEPEEPAYGSGVLEFAGGDYHVSVSYGEEAKIPDDSSLRVFEIEKGSAAYESYLAAARAAVGNTGAEVSARFFDITIVDRNGEEVVPAGNVSVSISYDVPESASAPETADVVHFDETEGVTEVVPAESAGSGEVSFETDGFSVFGVVYTVEFTYDGYTWVIEGSTSVLLSELAEAIGIAEDGAAFTGGVESVSFTDPSLIAVSSLGADWLLESLAPFDTTETLTITVTGGSKYLVTVTDASGGAATSSDLVSFLTDVLITGAEQSSTGAYQVVQGKVYTLTAAFSEGTEWQFDNTATLTYTMPAGITILEEQTGGLNINIVYKGETYTVDGTYTLDTNGNLSVTFDSADSDFPKLVSSTNVSFNFDLYGTFDGSATDIVFSDNIEYTVEFVEDEPGEAYVVKTASYDETTGTFTYLIQVTADGDVTNVRVRDQFTGNALALGSGITVTESGNEFSGYTDNGATGNYVFDYTIASMTDGQVIDIEYTASVNFSMDTDKDGTITAEQTGNTVTVQPENGTERKGEYSREITFVTTQKSGGTDAGMTADGDRVLDWTISYNDLLTASVAGYTITDTIDSASQAYMKYYGDGITVNAYDANGIVYTESIPYSSLMYFSDSSWTYKIPEDHTGVYRYEITYQTVVDMSEVNGAHTTVNLSNSANGSWAGISVTSEDTAGIDKSVVSYDTSEVTWLITLTIPAEGLSSAVVTDYLPGKYNYTDSIQYTDIYRDGSLTVNGLEDGETYSVDDSQPGILTVTFYQDGSGTPGLQGTGSQRTVTVTLTTEVNQDWLQTGYGSAEYQTHENKVSFNGLPASAQVTYGKPQITKTVAEESGTQLRYTLVLSGDITEPVEILDRFDTDLLELDTSCPVAIYGGTQYWQSTAGSISCSQTAEGILLTAASLPKNTDGTLFGYYRIEYVLKTKSGKTFTDLAEENYGITVTNTAIWGEKEATCTYEKEYSPLDKKLLNGEELGDSNRTAQYSITFNESKARLNQGANIPMIDVISANQSLDYSSVRIVTDPAGASVSYTVSGGENGTTVVKYIVPDNTKVSITYSTLIVGTGEQPFTNTVSAAGRTATVNKTVEFASSGQGSAGIASFKIVKVDGYDATKKLSGVQFKVFEETGNYAFDDSGTKEIFLTTDENGGIVLDGTEYDFYFNVVYHIQEVEPPEGYEKIGIDYTVTLTDDMTKVNYGKYIYYFTDSMQIKNWPLEGIIVEKAVESSEEADLTKEFSFRISVLNEDGTVNASFNDSVGGSQFTSGTFDFTLKDGQQKSFYGFAEGTKYKVEELLDSDSGFTTAVSLNGGTAAAGTSYTGTLEEDYDLILFTNTKESPGSLKITKNVTVGGAETEGTLADGTYEFTILDSDGNPASGKVNGTEITDGKVTVTITNGVSQTVEVTDLPAGTYTVTETAPTNGTSIVGTNPVTVTVTGGQTGDSVSEEATAAFTNNQPVGSLKITKNVTVNGETTAESYADGTYTFTILDSNGNPASGKVNGAEITGGKVTVTITNGVSQTVEVTELLPGTYTVTETAPTNGTVIIGTNPVTVTVTGGETGDDVSAEASASFTNNLFRLAFSKRDAFSAEAVAGASFELRKGTEVVASWISSSSNDSPYVITGLEPGEYTLVETAAAEGYVFPYNVENGVCTSFPIILKPDGTVEHEGFFSSGGILIIEEFPTRIAFIKLDAVTGALLDGAEFTLYENADGALTEIRSFTIQSTSESEPYKIEGLKTETEYTLRETKAPEGYALMEDISFTLHPDSTITTDCPYVVEGGDSKLHILQLKNMPLTSVTVTKVWDDNDNAENARPESVTVQLFAGETAFGEPKTLNEAGGWTYTWTDLPVMANGQSVVYTVNETPVPDHYTMLDPVITGNAKDGFQVTITNACASVTAPIEVTKAFDSWGQADSFTFKLAAVTEGAPMPATDTATATEDDPAAAFGQISYAKAGTYEYTITEVNGGADGVSYDVSEHKVVVTVSEDEDTGIKTAAVTYDGAESLTITNRFTPVKASFQVTKVFDSWDQAESFTFKLAPVTANAPMPATDTATATKSNPAAAFGTIEFRKSGTYEYTITEVNGGADGVSYDTAAHKVVVTVTRADDATNALSAEVTYDGKTSLTVTNTFTPATASIEVKKIFDSWGQADSFEFKLAAVTEGAPMPATVTATATKDVPTAVFGKIEYVKAGTYQYTITEVNGGADGVSYDTTAHTVTVTVSKDDETNALSASVTYDNGGKSLQIANTFTPTTAAFQVTKVFDSWDQAESFTFKLVPVTANAPMPATDTATATKSNPAAAFGTIEFRKSGTYEYTITEVNGGADGVSYDTAAHKVVVTVTRADDATNALSAAVTYDGKTSLEIKNTYEPVKASFQVTKAFNDWGMADSFRFDLAAVTEGAPMPEITWATATESVKTASFGEIEYRKAGTYVYTITEQNAGEDGVAYDTSAHTVTVTVTRADDATNALSAEVTYDGKTSLKVTNTFTPATAAIEVKKIFDSWDQADSFEFKLAAVTANAPMPKSDTATATKDVPTAVFGKIEYVKAGTYQYTITEVNGGADGVSYDTTAHTVTVTVSKDDETNALSASVTYDNGGKSLQIANTFTPVKAAIEVTKSFNDWSKAESFTFRLTAVTEGAPMPSSDTATAVKDAATAAFGEIEYTKAGTYQYTITEQNDGAEGVSYDTSAHTVTVTVSKADDATNALSAEVTYDGEAEDLTITNTYCAPAEAEIKVTKVFDSWGQADSFEFTLAAVTEGAPMPATDTATATKNNPAAAFGQISYAKAGTYEYTITEVNGGADGVSYDTAAHTVTVTVSKNSDTNALSAEVTYDGGAEDLTITNTYTPVTASIEVTKSFNDWSRADSFEFTLAAVTEGAPMPSSDTATATKDSPVAEFGEIEFRKAGTYEYKLKETDSGAIGVTYDTAEHRVVVTVTRADDATNALSAEVTYDGAESLTVTNTYTPQEMEITITKVWEDAGDQDGIRPDSVEIKVTGSDGKTYTAQLDGTPETEVPGTAGGYESEAWKATFVKLPKYADGAEITYSFEETVTDVITGTDGPQTYGIVWKGTTVTNRHTPAQTSVSVIKIWNDAGNQDGIRPAGVEVQLYADGKPVGGAVTLNAAGSWMHIWTGLPLKADGKDIRYTVDEPNVPQGYSRNVGKVTKDAKNNYQVIIENSHTPEEIEISVRKEWKDSKNRSNTRPESITVNLLADGEVIASVKIKPDANDVWAYRFKGLPKYRAVGNEIEYTITEDAVTGYTTYIAGSAEEGYVIVNTFTPPGKKPPRTGDPSNLLLCFSAMLLSGAGIIWSCGTSRKKTRRNRS